MVSHSVGTSPLMHKQTKQKMQKTEFGKIKEHTDNISEF